MASFPALKEAEDHLAAKQKELSDIFAEAGDEMNMDNIKSISGDSKDKVDYIRKLNEELDDLGQKRDDLQTVAKAAERAKEHPEQGESGASQGHKSSGPKSVGELFTDSAAYKNKQGPHGPEAHLDVDLKTLFETGTGWAPETTRTGRLVPDAQRPIQVTDLIPQTTTSQSAVVYMEETTFTNNAAETSEGSAYGEAALALTEQSSTVRKIAVFLPVTDEQIEDEQQARGYVNNRLPFMVRQRLDSQIITGDGVAPNLEGFLNVTGLQTQSKGTDPVPDAVYKAMTKVRVTGRAMPSAVIFHPNDWQDVRLLRTSEGVYIWGAPSESGPARIWGLPVAESDAITENTALVGDYANFSELSVRRGMDVQVSNSHSDFFINGKQAVRADMRAALVVYRPNAFCTVTGI